jgi:hypothetical protein
MTGTIFNVLPRFSTEFPRAKLRLTYLKKHCTCVFENSLSYTQCVHQKDTHTQT